MGKSWPEDAIKVKHDSKQKIMIPQKKIRYVSIIIDINNNEANFHRYYRKRNDFDFDLSLVYVVLAKIQLEYLFSIFLATNVSTNI